MRILLAVHQFFPEYRAGTEVLTYSVAKALRALGHDVCVFTGFPTSQSLSDDKRFDEYTYDGLRVFRFHHSYVPMGGQNSLIDVGYDNAIGVACFESVLERFAPDVVHAFHLNRLGTRLIPRSRAKGTPIFMTPTDFWTICPTGQLLLDDGKLCGGPTATTANCVRHVGVMALRGAAASAFSMLPPVAIDFAVTLARRGWLPARRANMEISALSRRLTKNVQRLNGLSGIAAPNAFMASVLASHGVCPRIMRVIPFGVEDAPLRQAPRDDSARVGPLRFGFIGTLARHKGAHVLIEAMKQLPDGFATLSLYGAMSDFPEYVAELVEASAGRQDIEFKGTFPNEQINEVMASLDALVVPSIWFENTPLVLHSAKAARCPVIVSDLPGMTAVVNDGVDGLVFEAGNAERLAHHLLRLIRDKSFLDRLRSGIQPPKTADRYARDLIEFWAINDE